MADIETMHSVARRKMIDELMMECIERSVTSASGRTVERPASAARYATNALLFHDPKLLAAAAVLFARPEVERLLAEDRP